MFMAWFTISEFLNTGQLLSLVLLIFAAVLASVHIKGGSMKFSQASVLMIIASLCFSIYAVIFKYITQSMPILTALVWLNIFMFFLSFTFFIVPSFRTAWKEEMKGLDKKLAGGVFGIVLLDNFGTFFNLWALSLGPVALVYALEGFQSIFVFIFAIFISLFTAIDLHEELNRKNVIVKLIALFLSVIGVVMINLSS